MAENSVFLEGFVKQAVDSIKDQMVSRGVRASNELRNAAMMVLRGQRHGRLYKIPGTYRTQWDKKQGKKVNGRYYTASAPGEPPAVRTGAFRMGWQPVNYVSQLGDCDMTVISRVENNQKVNGYFLAELLQGGTENMAARPHQEEILKMAEPKVVRIYNEPYL